MLFSRLKREVQSTADFHMRSLGASIGLILHSAVQLKDHGLSDPELLPAAEVKVTTTLECLYQYLKELVGPPGIVGGSSLKVIIL